jgi:NAD-dependent dihydropyrimidine dehydrogenase PreA subunit
MAGLFIDVEVNADAAADAVLVAKLVEVCPVDIFESDPDGSLRIAQENLDECTLCDLCVEAAPAGSVKVVKLYE